MEETLQTQFDFSQNLVKSLQTVVTSYSTLVTNTQSQAGAIVKLVEEIDKSKDRMNRLLSKSQSLVDDLTSSLGINYVKNIEKRSSDSQKIYNASTNDIQKQFSIFFNAMSSNVKDFNKLASNLKLSQKQIQQLSLIRDKFGNFNKDLSNMSGDIDQTTESLETFEEIADKANIVKNAVMTGGTSLFIDVPKLLFGLMSSAANAFTSLVGAATKFYAFALTLPFTISQIAVKLGNSIRSDLVEVIQAGGEEAKEVFDLTSNIGQSANKMTQDVKSMLKDFQNPRSRLAQIFGTGAEGIAAFQKESFSLVDSMGHFAEIYGPSILGNTKNAQFMIEANRALAIGAQESAYYALDAYTSGENPVSYVADLSKKIKTIADNNDLDTKQIALQFHKLKTNIVDFGHLTSNEVLNLTTKLTKMRVSSEDAVSVFKKFSSLEEASKASAMLFQSFNMNIDAFDLLTSRDPAEMLMQFKNSMQATGKSFESLDRHEKALMKSITGISDQGLSSLMSLMDANMSYEEARNKMDQHNPTKKKTKLINSLSSSIKHFQKTLQFTSPFDAFFQGLSENALSQEELQGKLLNFNKIYESIYKIAFDLKPSDVESFTKPVVAVLTKIKNIFISGDFLKLTKLVTKTTADFMSDFAIDLYSQKDAKNFHLFRLKVNETFERLGNNQSAVIKAEMLRTTDSELVHMKNFLESSEVPDTLKAVFKKNKQGIYKIAKGASLDSILGAITSASENLPNDSEYKASLNRLRVSLDNTYIKEIESINATKSMQEAQKSVQKRTSVTGRIDRLYDNLIEMFSKGSPLFKQFHDIAGKIMGSMVTGAMEGMIAIINLFNGGVDQSVAELGIATEDELQRQFGKKDATLLDYLGINTSDVTELEQGLSKESSRFASNLPSMMSIAGSLFGDLTDLFSTFALSVIGILGGFSLSYYEKSNNITKAAMVASGFNPMNAMKASLESKKIGKHKKEDFFGSLVSAHNKGGKEHGDLGQVTSLFLFLNNYKKSLNKKSLVHQFLDNKKIANQSEYLLNGFTSALAELSPADKSRINFSRIQGLYHIIETAKHLDNYIPNSLYDIAEGKSKDSQRAQDFINSASKNKNYKNILNQAIGVIPSKSIVYYRSMSDLDEHASEVKRYAESIKKHDKNNKTISSVFDGTSNRSNKKNKKYFEKLLKDRTQSKDYKQVFKKQKKGPIDSLVGAFRANAELSDDDGYSFDPIGSLFGLIGSGVTYFADDFYAKEKDMKVLIGNKIFNLSDEDTIVAFKSGGYFDKVFSKNNTEISLLTNENLEIKVENNNLKKVVKEVEKNIEADASESDLFELFNLFKEVTDMLENREIIVEEPQIVFN